MNNLSEHIQIDFRASLPIYLQIVRQIEGLVAGGQLQVGDQLPTVRELATDLRINFNTVARAYHVLDEARLISTQRGRGTFIWEEPDAHHLDKIRARTIHELAQHYLEGAEKLGYSPAETVEALIAVLPRDTRPAQGSHSNEQPGS